MSPPTLKIMDEKLTVSYSELTGSPSMSMIFVLNKYKSHATYSDGSICVGGLSVQEDTDFSTELLILVEVSV